MTRSQTSPRLLEATFLRSAYYSWAQLTATLRPFLLRWHTTADPLRLTLVGPNI